jgi:hypothetical protein
VRTLLNNIKSQTILRSGNTTQIITVIDHSTILLYCIPKQSNSPASKFRLYFCFAAGICSRKHNMYYFLLFNENLLVEVPLFVEVGCFNMWKRLFNACFNPSKTLISFSFFFFFSSFFL